MSIRTMFLAGRVSLAAVSGISCVAVVLAVGGCAAGPVDQEEKETVFALADRLEHMTGTSWWPGFDPLAIPLAVYDGERTYLFRHPSPPEEFTLVESAEPVAGVYEGRHPAVTANTSAAIGGVMTATLMVGRSDPGRSLTDVAAVAMHEAFHVYQRERHPGWQANEADLFVYPIDDAQLLARRRLETAALRRALADSDDAGSGCWTRAALSLRRERFSRMDSAFATYERGTELNEGLAAYVELKAAGRQSVDIPSGGFGAAEVRQRAYATGPALALLLDRFQPGWAMSFEAEDQQHLDEALEAAVGAAQESQCIFSGEEISEAERVARQDVSTLLAGRAERRAAFESVPGWHVVVQAVDGRPLWPQGFDPLNVERSDGGLVHTRFLRLGNDSGQLEAMDTEGGDLEALSEGVGPHPLFNGVRRVIVAGLEKPEVTTTEDGLVSVRAAGLAVDFQNASVSQSGTEVVVQLETPE